MLQNARPVTRVALRVFLTNSLKYNEAVTPGLYRSHTLTVNLIRSINRRSNITSIAFTRLEESVD